MVASFLAPAPVANRPSTRHSCHRERSVCTPRASAAARSPHTVIIGGGAAGHLAAISLQEHTPTRATILEASPRVLQKVRISGGGRCNVTSANDADSPTAFASHYPRGRRELRSLLAVFPPARVVQFFERIGVALKVEPGGKVFPVSDDSHTVIRALCRTAATLGVVTRTRARVIALEAVHEAEEYPAGRPAYRVELADGEVLFPDYVLVATGGAIGPHAWARRLGHVVVPPVPSLFTFGVDDPVLEGLAGVSVADVSIRLDARGDGSSQRGPLLITHWGLSGPAVLSLSAFAARELHRRKYHVHCTVDWVPSVSRAEKANVLKAAKRSMSSKNISTVCPFRELPKRLWRRLVADVAEGKWGQQSNAVMEAIAERLHRTPFEVTSKGEFKDEFVTAGGVRLADVNMKTFESKVSPGLYFAGEALDVDGRTGGYNLEFAWSSGYMAGASIAQKILDTQGISESELVKAPP